MGPCRRPRSFHRRRLICYSVLSFSVVARLIISSVISSPSSSHSSRRRRSSSQRAPFSPARCSLFLFSSSRRLPSWLVSSCRLVRRFACSSLVVPLLVPPRRLVSHSSARPRSPFLDTAGRGVLPFDGDGQGKQARGRAGRWIARGVASKQTRRATIGRYEDAPPHLRDGAGRRGVSFFFS